VPIQFRWTNLASSKKTMKLNIGLQGINQFSWANLASSKKTMKLNIDDNKVLKVKLKIN
jgi:hypothetical protein